jgi:formylglycine-generating enzyme required for sulfatase activity
MEEPEAAARPACCAAAREDIAAPAAAGRVIAPSTVADTRLVHLGGRAFLMGGDELTPDGQWMCNIWQGEFPTRNTMDDGYLGTAPLGAFAPNGFGLHDLTGNVWEWCADWFSPTHTSGATTDPEGPSGGASNVIRGGSYLCHRSHCNRYRVVTRTANTPDSSTGNMGFRCAASPG